VTTNPPTPGRSPRARLRPHRVARLAEQQRLRTGIWFDHAGHICQHCPACGTSIRIPDPPEYSDGDGDSPVAHIVEHRLDEAVFEHLLLDLCPTPERSS
jgi:hypothetical protein